MYKFYFKPDYLFDTVTIKCDNLVNAVTQLTLVIGTDDVNGFVINVEKIN